MALVRWALGSITTNKAGGGDGIPTKLFQILKDDAVKVLHSICQQIWTIPRSGRFLGEGNGNPLVFLPGEFQGQRSLVGFHLWGRTE